MARWKGTLIGGGIGWAFGGPIGGILGAIIGNAVEAAGARVARDYDGREGGGSFSTAHDARSSTPGDFAVSLLVLFAHVVKADNKILSEEIKYVKEYLIRQFGSRNAKDMMLIFRDLLEKDYNIQVVCRQIDSHLTYHSKLEMLHILFGIAISDRHLHDLEIKAIHDIAQSLRISETDYNSIKAIFVKDEDQAYRILGLTESASDDDVKTAYRELAKKYHPDKIHDLGEDFRKVAEEKFKAVNNAYQEIKNRRGF